MINRLRINPLLLFLSLGMILLLLVFPQIKLQLNGETAYKTIDLNLNDQLDFPEQGWTKSPQIRTYNPNFTLYYSVDGGDHFSRAGEKLMVNELRNSTLLYKKTSIRWRHPIGEFPTLFSLCVKLRDEQKKIESSVMPLTYFDQLPGELPIVHLTVSEADLFDWNKGMMIYGEAGSHDDGFQKDWWYRSANFAERGSEWGRKVHFQYFLQGKLMIEQPCEMKISGNATRYFPQKSLKFYPLNEDGKRGKLDYPLWGINGSNKCESFLLRQGGNDNLKTMFADLLMHNLADGGEVMVQNGYPVSVFINGNYWGIYNLRERVDDYFIAKEENVPSDSVTILYCEVYGDRTLLKAGNLAVKKEFDSLIEGLASSQELSNKEYDQLKEKISIKSFIDYIFFETFYANQDWLHNNTTWYKAGDKKWKWLLNDLDYSLYYPGEINLNANLFNDLKRSESITAQLFNHFWTVKKFREKFKQRVTELINEFFSDERIDDVVGQLMIQYRPEIELQIKRWRMIDSKEQWEKDVAKNVTFLKNRRTIYLKQVDDL